MLMKVCHSYDHTKITEDVNIIYHRHILVKMSHFDLIIDDLLSYKLLLSKNNIHVFNL